jgi:hypothetical protein
VRAEIGVHHAPRWGALPGTHGEGMATRVECHLGSDVVSCPKSLPLALMTRRHRSGPLVIVSAQVGDGRVNPARSGTELAKSVGSSRSIALI